MNYGSAARKESILPGLAVARTWLRLRCHVIGLCSWMGYITFRFCYLIGRLDIQTSGRHGVRAPVVVFLLVCISTTKAGGRPVGRPKRLPRATDGEVDAPPCTSLCSIQLIGRPCKPSSSTSTRTSTWPDSRNSVRFKVSIYIYIYFPSKFLKAELDIGTNTLKP